MSVNETCRYAWSVTREGGDIEMQRHWFCKEFCVIFLLVSVIVRSMKTTSLERWLNSQVSPIPLISVWKFSQFCVSIVASGSLTYIPKLSLMKCFRKGRTVEGKGFM